MPGAASVPAVVVDAHLHVVDFVQSVVTLRNLLDALDAAAAGLVAAGSAGRLCGR